MLHFGEYYRRKWEEKKFTMRMDDKCISVTW